MESYMKENKRAINKVKKIHTSISKNGNGDYIVELVVDFQRFNVYVGNRIGAKETQEMLAIALCRLVHTWDY